MDTYTHLCSPSDANNHVHHLQSHVLIPTLALNFSDFTATCLACLDELSCCRVIGWLADIVNAQPNILLQKAAGGFIYKAAYWQSVNADVATHRNLLNGINILGSQNTFITMSSLNCSSFKFQTVLTCSDRKYSANIRAFPLAASFKSPTTFTAHQMCDIQSNAFVSSSIARWDFTQAALHYLCTPISQL